MPLLSPLALLVCLFLPLLRNPAAAAQDPPPAAQDPAPAAQLEFFSGYVAEVAEDHVVVTRNTLAKTSERRTFRMTEQTKVEGKLRVKARVTVGYSKSDSGDVAQQIIVREREPKKKGP